MKQKEFEGKSIIVGIPNHFGLPQRFKENLEFLGFEVFLLENFNNKSLSLFDKIIHGYKKLTTGDRTHKPLMKNKLAKGKILKQLSSIEKADYALFVRPDLFDFEVIEKAKQLATKTIPYQLDGMSRFPLAERYISYFDNFYVFDKNDLNLSPKLQHTTNFYFDDIIISNPDVTPKSVFFVGSYIKNRIPLINKIIEVLEKNHLTPNIYLFARHKKANNAKFKIIAKGFSFKESAQKIQQSEFLLDFHNPIHNGLSFRTFESIGYEKKLITDNVLVKGFEFYNPNNIFIIENENFKRFEEFATTPYEPLAEEIKEKYSFTNWIKQLLTQ